MNIAVIVHSKTGTTLKLGNMYAENLRKKGHVVDVVELKTNKPVNSGTAGHHPDFSITNLPDPKKYDALLVGGPVWAFSASPVIYEAVKGLKDISGKKVLPFTCMGFPHESMGGKQAIDLLSKTLTEKGANVLPGKIIPGLFHNKEKTMEKAVSEVASLF
jgi:NAD(P)H dehydrogenase (quinone)